MQQKCFIFFLISVMEIDVSGGDVSDGTGDVSF